MENKSQLEEDNIDLGKLIGIAVTHKKQVGSIIAGCTILAAGISFILPRQYESTTLVQTRSAGQDISGAAAMASMMGVNVGGAATASSPVNYMELMKSRRVLEPIIDAMEWEDEEKKPEAENFAKKISGNQKYQTNESYNGYGKRKNSGRSAENLARSGG